MTVPSTYLHDFLSGRKLSSLFLFEDSTPLQSSVSLWPTMCKHLCEQFSCLIVQSELPGSSSPDTLPLIEKVSFWDFPSAIDCLAEVRKRISNMQPNSKPWVIFFENMDSFLLDCPPDLSIIEWARLISSHLLSLSKNPSTVSVIYSLNIYKSSDGEITFMSSEVKEIFEFSATTCIRLFPSNASNKFDAAFWHRRTFNSICKSIRTPSQVAPSNKPTTSGICRIVIDPKTQLIVNCINLVATKNAPDELVNPTLPISNVVPPYQPPTQSLSECKIEYEPDAFDDLDEEDPDDDLDI